MRVLPADIKVAQSISWQRLVKDDHIGKRGGSLRSLHAEIKHRVDQRHGILIVDRQCLHIVVGIARCLRHCDRRAAGDDRSAASRSGGEYATSRGRNRSGSSRDDDLMQPIARVIGRQIDWNDIIGVGKVEIDLQHGNRKHAVRIGECDAGILNDSVRGPGCEMPRGDRTRLQHIAAARHISFYHRA